MVSGEPDSYSPLVRDSRLGLTQARAQFYAEALRQLPWVGIAFDVAFPTAAFQQWKHWFDTDVLWIVWRFVRRELPQVIPSCAVGQKQERGRFINSLRITLPALFLDSDQQVRSLGQKQIQNVPSFNVTPLPQCASEVADALFEDNEKRAADEHAAAANCLHSLVRKKVCQPRVVSLHQIECRFQFLSGWRVHFSPFT